MGIRRHIHPVNRQSAAALLFCRAQAGIFVHAGPSLSRKVAGDQWQVARRKSHRSSGERSVASGEAVGGAEAAENVRLDIAVVGAEVAENGPLDFGEVRS
jgi:hypothetical protein